ncbi:MAG TPA: VacJ family lipoprotein [Rhizomicrobium sp.]|jgi:phospholipid-binding lipoprotein MlaA
MATRFLFIAMALAVALGGCETTPEQDANNDPLEPVNRVMFDINFAVDRYVGVPAGAVYTAVVPKPVRHGIHNALQNLGAPVTFSNDLLQGEPERAAQTLYRFGVNSTFGIGGLIDIGSIAGVPPHREDFGQTLGVYGVGEGPYLVLPFIGPAPPRDLAGHYIDAFMDPLYYISFEGRHKLLIGRHFAGLADGQAEAMGAVKQIEASADPYAAARSAYRQHRNAEIRNGVPDTNHLPDITNVPPTSDTFSPFDTDTHKE